MKPAVQPIETLDAPSEIQKPSPQARYSQPLPQSVSTFEPLILRAGFIGKGANKRIGFHFVRRTKDGYKRVEVETTKQNEAQTQPRGFFQSLASMYSGSEL